MSHPSCEERIDASMKREISRLSEALGPETPEEEVCQMECFACEHKWQSEDDLECCPACDSDDAAGWPIEPEEPRETRDRYMEGVLEISPIHIVYRVGLSWGGPADGFYLYVDPEDRTIDRVEYYFQDWFDGATREVTGDALDLVRNMFEVYVQKYD